MTWTYRTRIPAASASPAIWTSRPLCRHSAWEVYIHPQVQCVVLISSISYQYSQSLLIRSPFDLGNHVQITNIYISKAKKKLFDVSLEKGADPKNSFYNFFLHFFAYIFCFSIFFTGICYSLWQLIFLSLLLGLFTIYDEIKVLDKIKYFWDRPTLIIFTPIETWDIKFSA